MPVIVFASPKGGVGKSTSAVLLATELAQNGAAIDSVTEDSIIETIEEASAETAFVMADLEVRRR